MPVSWDGLCGLAFCWTWTEGSQRSNTVKQVSTRRRFSEPEHERACVPRRGWRMQRFTSLCVGRPPGGIASENAITLSSSGLCMWQWAGRDLLDNLFCGPWPRSPAEVSGRSGPETSWVARCRAAQKVARHPRLPSGSPSPSPSPRHARVFFGFMCSQAASPGSCLPACRVPWHCPACWGRLGTDLLLCGREVTSHDPDTSGEPTHFWGLCSVCGQCDSCLQWPSRREPSHQPGGCGTSWLWGPEP